MTEAIRVIPAVLTAKPQELNEMLKISADFTDYVQIDFMDGKFVPSLSVKPEEIKEVPDNLTWEAHMMIEKPLEFLNAYKSAGAKKIIFHFEAASNPMAVIELARSLSIGVGIAVNPETSNTDVMPFIDKVDSLLYMAVHPGFYGAKFIPEVLDKVKEMRRVRPQANIGLDGGVKEYNIADIAQSGVNEIFVGSAIFMQADPPASYLKLLSIANDDVS